MIEGFLGNLKQRGWWASGHKKTNEERLTGSRTMNDTAVENAAMVNTARNAMAYESRAALCVSGGNVETSVAEWRILLIS